MEDENIEAQANKDFPSQDATDLYSASSQSEETAPTEEPHQSDEQEQVDSIEADASEEIETNSDGEPEIVETSQQNEATGLET